MFGRPAGDLRGCFRGRSAICSSENLSRVCVNYVSIPGKRPLSSSRSNFPVDVPATVEPKTPNCSATASPPSATLKCRWKGRSMHSASEGVDRARQKIRRREIHPGLDLSPVPPSHPESAAVNQGISTCESTKEREWCIGVAPIPWSHLTSDFHTNG